MPEEVPLTTEEAVLLVNHLVEALEAIREERPLRATWVPETMRIIVILMARVQQAEGGPDPRMN